MFATDGSPLRRTLVAVSINFLSVGADFHFIGKEKAEPKKMRGS
jgi:hypothetical protein